MPFICHEITRFAHVKPLRIFMIGDINITANDVRILLDELKNDRLEILSLNNVNLNDEGANYFRDALEINCNEKWKDLTRIFLSRNSKISLSAKKAIKLSWTRAYGYRNDNLEKQQFFLFCDGI